VVDLLFALVHVLLPLGFLTFWAASAAWVASDTRRRCPERMRPWTAVAAAVPLGGAALYALVRPCEPRAAQRERMVWRHYLEAELDPGERCLACRTPLRPEFRCCPGCGDELRHECRSCGGELRIGWAACPHCLAPVLEPFSAAA
jgi:hypothetical protein